MSNLTSIEKIKLERLFGMSGGYVLNFSNRTFEEFFQENFEIEIYNPRYDYGSGSKANRLRAFWKVEDNLRVGRLITLLLDYWKLQKELNNDLVTIVERGLFDDCQMISDRLINNVSIKNQPPSLNDSNLELNILLNSFEELTKSTDYQRRGYILQDLLNNLFRVYKIQVINSFQRNMGGEQIDGAFIYQGWHYLVECKWTKSLSDIRELDSLLGKVNRSGKQTMGLFLSIEGWSKNIPLLLKQNPEKCIFLMDGYDLRSALSNAIDLNNLLNKKIAKLNLEAEPFFSVVDILNL